MKKIIILMKKIIIAVLLLIFSYSISAQRISKNGNYVCVNTNEKMTVQSIKTGWKKEIRSADFLGNLAFSKNERNFFYKLSDTIFKLKLETNEQYLKSDCDLSTIQCTKFGKGEWAAYRLKSKKKELVLLNLETWEEQHFDDIIDFSFDEGGSSIILKIQAEQSLGLTTELKWVNLLKWSVTDIWKTASAIIGDYCMDLSGNQLAFIVQDRDGTKFQNSIWYYKTGMNSAKILIDDTSNKIDDSLEIGVGKLRFSGKGSQLFFNLKEKETSKSNSKLASVDVWSYTDAVLQSTQLQHLEARNYEASISISNQNIIRLQRENEFLINELGDSETSFPNKNDDYSLVCHFDGDIFLSNTGPESYMMNEYNWNKSTRSNVYLISTTTGERKLLKSCIKPINNSFPYFILSPGGRYVLYYDQTQKNYFSYEITTGKRRNLTNNLLNNVVINDSEQVRSYYQNWNIAYWLSNDDAFFVYDRYGDILQLDPSGQKKAQNITNGYAKKRKIKFTWVQLCKGDSLLLKDSIKQDFPFSNVNYYLKKLHNKAYPQKITNGAFRFTMIKASERSAYLVNKEDALTNINWYYTIDFRDFKTIVNYNPKLTEEITDNRQIFRWKTFDGEIQQGILFKPLNFNRHKRYPVIFGYYQKAASQGGKGVIGVNYKYLLNHGYLIFVPDINYKIGQTGPCVYNSVVSAANFVSKLKFVNPRKMGLIGNSFAGYETNYLVTHSNVFAAAYSSSGFTDLVSLYGRIEDSRGGIAGQTVVEVGQGRIGATIWERPDLYLKNSPIFYADRVTTPILLVANKGDDNVPWTQGVEFFKALRRLGKKAWLLQDDDAVHGPSAQEGLMALQFLDHYLKDSPAPLWMTKGIPAKMKGKTLRMEYDTIMKTPGPGLLMENNNALTPDQRKLLKHRTTVNNQGRIIDVSTKGRSPTHKVISN